MTSKEGDIEGNVDKSDETDAVARESAVEPNTRIESEFEVVVEAGDEGWDNLGDDGTTDHASAGAPSTSAFLSASE